jgi:50S ribosomal protein uL3
MERGEEMLSGLLGKKVGMTQVFGPQGTAIPVTIIETGPCVVTQIKTAASDGYEAVQIGFGKARHATRPELGHLGHTLAQLPAQRRKQQQAQAKARSEARAKAAEAQAEAEEAEEQDEDVDEDAEEEAGDEGGNAGEEAGDEEEASDEAGAAGEAAEGAAEAAKASREGQKSGVAGKAGAKSGEATLEAQAQEAEARGKAEVRAAPTGKQALTAQRDPKRKRAGGGLGPFEVLREVQVLGGAAIKVGQKFDATMFKPGELVDVVGTSKGKGFQGVMKRHGFGGGPGTHGQSDRPRAPGSIGAGNTPGRILKNTRMAGHMGATRITVQALEVVAADAERNVILVKGSIPGPTGGLVMVRKVASSFVLAERLQQQQTTK